MASCIAKYGADFCSRIEKRCYELQSIPFTQHQPGTLYEIPQAISVCLTTETILDKCISKYDREFCRKLERTCASLLGITLPNGVVRALPAIVVQCITKEHPVATCRAKYGSDFCDKLEARCYQQNGIPTIRYRQGTLPELPQAIVVCLGSGMIVDMCAAKYGKEFCVKLKTTCADMIGIKITGGPSGVLPEVVVRCLSTEHPVAICVAKYGADFCSRIERRCYELQSIPFVKPQPGTLYEVPQAIAICITTETVLDTCLSKYGREFCRALETSCASMLGVSLPTGVVLTLPAAVVQCITKEHPVATCRAKYGRDFCDKLESRCYKQQNIAAVKPQLSSLNELPQTIAVCIKSEVVVDLCAAKYSKEFCVKLKSKCAEMLGITLSSDFAGTLAETVINCVSSEHPMATCMAKYGSDFCRATEKRCHELQNIPFIKPQPGTLYELPIAIANCLRSETALDQCVLKYDRKFCDDLAKTCASMLGVHLSGTIARALPASVMQCITKEHPVATCKAKYGEDFCNKLEGRCQQKSNRGILGRRSGGIYELPQEVDECIRSEVVSKTCVEKYGREFCKKLESTCTSMLNINLLTGDNRNLPIEVTRCISSENPMVTCTAKYGSDFCNKVRDRCQKLIGKSVTNNKMNVVYDLPQTITICIASEVTLYSCETKYGSTFCTKLQMTCASMLGIPLPLGGTRNLTPAVAKCIATEHPLATCVAKYGPEFCNKLQDRCYEIQNLRSIKRMPGALFELPQVITSCISSETARHTCIKKHGHDFCKKVEGSCASMLGVTLSIGDASILSPDVVVCLTTEHPMATCVAKYGSDFCNKLRKRCSDIENISAADRNFGPMSKLPEATVRCMTAEVTMHSCISKYGRQFCGKLKTVCASMVGTFVSPGPIANLPANVVNCMASEDPIALCIAKYGSEFCQKFKQRCYDAENVFIIDPVPGKSYQLPEAVAACIKSEVVQHTCVSKYGLEFCRNMETACATILHVSARRASSSALSVKVVECISSEHPLATCVAKYGADFCNQVKDRCLKTKNSNLPNALYQLPQEIANCISSETVLQTCLKKYGREFCKKLEFICSSMLSISTNRGSNQAISSEVASCISSDHTIVLCIAKYGKDFCDGLKRRCSDAENVFDLDETPGALYELPKAIAGCMFAEMAMHDCTLKNSRKYCEKLQGACFKMLGIALPTGSIRNLPSKVVKCMTSEHPVATCVAKYGTDFCTRVKERCYGVDSKIISEPTTGLVYELPEIIASCISSEVTVSTCVSRYGKDFCNQFQVVCSSMLRTLIPSGNNRQLPSNVLKCISTENALALCMAKYGAEFCNALLGRCYQSQNMPVVEQNPESLLLLPDAVSACISLEVALHYCKSKYDSQFCAQLRFTCSSVPAGGSLASSTYRPNNAVATCIFAEIALHECRSKNGEEYCTTLEAVCRLMLGIPTDSNGTRNIPPVVGRCMSSGNAMATCAAKYGTEFCSGLKGKCSNMLNLPVTKFEPGSLPEMPEAVANCMSSEVTLQSCISRYDREFCFKLKSTCISMLGASVSIGPTHPLAKVVADCISTEYPLAMCLARYDAAFCRMLQKRCSKDANGFNIKKIPGSLPLLPQPLMDCMSSVILISRCITSYGVMFCSKLESACSSLHGVSVSSASGRIILLAVRKCILSEILAVRCTQTYGFNFCNRSKLASNSRLNLHFTPYIPDVEELNCYIYHGFSECITMMNLCMKDKSNEGRPLAVSEWECAKSQIIIANCKTLYGPQCEILQEQCAVATGSARVKIGNGGVYQMPIPLRNCIAEGGAMAMCKVHHDHTKCNTWKVQCYTALGLPVTSTVMGKYEKLPTPVALCVSAQDLMARCKAAIGTSVCDLLLDECRGRFGSPSITLSSNSLYSLSPQLINCIQHRYKRTSPFIRQ